MSNEFVKQYKEGLDFATGLFQKFLDICPENIWDEKFGGWHVSQQFYHALGATGMFAASFTGQQIDGYRQEAGKLVKGNKIVPTKEEAGKLLNNVKSAIEKLISALQDNDLLKINEQATKVLGRDITNGRVLGLMSEHMLYHLGCCDAALRSHGLEGAF